MILRLTEKDFVQRPWKNLRGSTLELLKWPRGSGEEFLFRLSRADLTESGPFSSFPGIDRVLVITEGAPVTLKMDSGETHLPLWETFSFRGEEDVFADVRGPGKDFNLMTKRDAVTGGVEIARGKKTFKVDAEFFLVFTPDLLELHLVHGERGSEFTMDHPGNYLVIRVNGK